MKTGASAPQTESNRTMQNRRPAPSAHVWANLGDKAAAKDKAAGFKLPCYVFGNPPEYVRAYCLSYGYDASGKPL